ncbi:MAG TPA: tetratricopeptide repeat protein [Kofleriaceae bacterium]|nr:tetratricopeptide repeat protein [Kofleriaceae bacterium]
MSFALAGASIVALGLGAGACGGKNKSASTTPGGGTTRNGSAPGGEGHMTDAEPGDVGPDGGGGGGGGANTGGGNANNGGGGGGVADTEPPPPITPVNLDPSPEQSRAAVEQHLAAGRLALKGPQVDADLALREAQAALSVDATNVDAVALLAHAYISKRLYDTAEVILDMLLKERKDAAASNARIYYDYGLIYDKTARDAQAVLAYKTAVQLDPSFTSALINLGVHQLANKQYSDAIDTYEKVQKLGGVDAAIWVNLGDAYRGHSADFDPGSTDRDQLLLKAQTAYQRAVDLDRNFGAAYYNLGLLYLDADPFPTGGGPMDTLQRLNKAKTYFDQYKDTAGADRKLYDERSKDVDKMIKRETKKRKKAGATP